MTAGSVLICTARAISSSWRIFSPSISASVMRTRCSATAHCAASALASSSSLGIEDAPGLVQDLHHAHEHVLVVDERQREHAAGPVARRPVDVGIEARVRVAVRDVDDLCGRARRRRRSRRRPGTRTGAMPVAISSTSSFAAGSYSQTEPRSACNTCFAALTTSASIVMRSNGAASLLVTARITSRSGTPRLRALKRTLHVARM